jgi:hypothetical protein
LAFRRGAAGATKSSVSRKCRAAPPVCYEGFSDD